MKTQVWLAFIFGVTFLLIALAFALVAFYLPKPPNPQVVGNFLNVMQVILAISASGVAAVIPGFLSVDIQKKLGDKGSAGIRAGGAIAVFVLVYVISPKSLALDQLNQRVGYNERLDQCMSFVPAFGTPMTGALNDCLEVARLDPERWEAYRQLGRIYFWNAHYKDAIENYKKSISLMVGTNFDEIKREDQIQKEIRISFSSMNLSVAMAYVGLANTDLTDPKEKIDAYQRSLSVAEMSRWFVKDSAGAADLLNDLVYLNAINHAYIWLADKSLPVEAAQFGLAVHEFNQFLAMPYSVPQWAEYHLSCLYAAAVNRSDGAVNDYVQIARTFLIKALRHLLHIQSERSVVQRLMMRCRLRDPEDCQPPRGSEPMVCLSVAKLFKDDPEIALLVQNL
ncbi:MAG TPA: tetratricopeptide repeat protein [Bradyrhizobium sp.]|jgi:tetratricopeptide (TPR) repeat protein|nr:tetratricopeptide repeat protein [Bradyrhizobium sp.]